jgi:cysteinyl-tRNA synthetase
MVTIRLWNTATRTEEVFTPLDPENVRMYVCGPTVYDRAHLGNARPVVVFDVLYRLLRHVYGAGHVTYVRNITDVEDKIIDRAAERGIGIDQLTRTTTEWFHEDMAALGVDYAGDPNFREPHATDYIPEMIAMIATLIERGHAYEADGHVLFAVESYGKYGALSGRSVADMLAGARVEVAPYKRNPMDFVLWKPSSADQPGWDSPWGRGRPGWHIECSAMSHALLGESFDIHGGGIDLQFPHHENEIAQSCCAHPEGGFARYWLHNEMLQVEGRKMSKSLGNFFTVRDLLDRGVPGEVIRMVFLGTHYRKPMDWTEEKAREARGHLVAWDRLGRHALSRQIEASEVDRLVAPEIVDALAQDLNTPLALSRLFELAAAARLSTGKDSAESLRFFASLRFLGFHDLDVERLDRRFAAEAADGAIDRLEELAERLAAARSAAMATRDFGEVDRMKAALVAAGVEVRMGKAGVDLVPGPGFDPAKLEDLQ